MAKSKTKPFQEQAAEQIRQEALGIAKGIQRPGQTKQQTKLIAQGIAKGIELYKKQHKEKVRELDRERKKLGKRTVEIGELEDKPAQVESLKNTKASTALLFGGITYGLLAIGLVTLAIPGVEIQIAHEIPSSPVLIAVGVTMAVLSVWMLWVRG